MSVYTKDNERLPPGSEAAASRTDGCNAVDEATWEEGVERYGLKRTHATVLNALRIANMVSGRVASVADVAKALTRDERIDLQDAHVGKEVPASVAKILAQLHARGIVVSPGRVGPRRFYAAPDVLTQPEVLELPTIDSRRQRVMALVRKAVSSTRAPVRLADVVTVAAALPLAQRLTRSAISHDLLSLAATGDLQIVERVRGGGVEGAHLFLPSDCDVGDFPVRSAPTTWVEVVAHVFDECWADEVANANRENRRPRPLTTGTVRARLASNYGPAATDGRTEHGAPECISEPLRQLVRRNLANPIVLVNAMQTLATGTTPIARRIERSDGPAGKALRANLWAPADTPNEELEIDSAFANDSERVAEAVRRACRTRGVPAVQRGMVEEEIAIDPVLRLSGSQTVARYLADCAKLSLDHGDGTRKARVVTAVHQVGRVGGKAYYTCAESHTSTDRASTPADREADAYGVVSAEAYVATMQLRLDWEGLALKGRLRRVGEATVHSLAIGRAMLLMQEASAFSAKLSNLLADPAAAPGAIAGGAVPLHKRVARLMEEATAIARVTRLHSDSQGLNVLPDEVDDSVPGWTAAELFEVIRDLYPRAASLKDPIELVPLLGRAVRRVPNPDFSWRKEGAEFLFDRTDAMLYAAKQWAGSESILMAGLAEAELERVRDVRFVLPALKSRDVSVRLSGVACLAFLPSAEAHDALRRTALTDSEAGVRRGALWGYGVSGGVDVETLAREILEDDSAPTVASLAEQAVKGQLKWWSL